MNKIEKYVEEQIKKLEELKELNGKNDFNQGQLYQLGAIQHLLRIGVVSSTYWNDAKKVMPDLNKPVLVKDSLGNYSLTELVEMSQGSIIWKDNVGVVLQWKYYC